MNQRIMDGMRMTRALAFLAAGALASTALADTPAVVGADAADARFRGTGKADPIRVENVRRTDGPAAGQSTILFDLAWDHSWRAAWDVDENQHGGKGTLKLESWDAAWVFVKFRQGSEGHPASPGSYAGAGWFHAMLAPTPADHLVPAAATLDVGLSDVPSAGPGAGDKRGVGVFVYRKAPGSGPNVFKDIALLWPHPSLVDEAPFDPAQVEVRVFAIQMVRVPECAFWAGDGSTNMVMGHFSVGATIQPFRITGEQALTLGGDAQEALTCRDTGKRNSGFLDDFDPNVTKTLPAAFPKGYRAFYCMRHEITQQEYTDFLNTIPYAAQSARSGKQASSPPGTLGISIKNFDVGTGRLGVKIATSGVANKSDPVIIRRETFVASRTREDPGKPAVFAADEPHAPCNYISHVDGSYYAAWAGLRPMTELEFEKACRGPLKPVPDEYAWGTAGIAGVGTTNGAYRVRNIGKPDENAVWEGDAGPDAERGNALLSTFRCEAETAQNGRGPLRAGIFATPASDRVSAGASYWGILELSGSVQERCMSVGRQAGRKFAGRHGDGITIPWLTDGFGGRGGGANRGDNLSSLALTHRVSERSGGAWPNHDRRHCAQGFRCVRTAP